jgi:hypothetical protein
LDGQAFFQDCIEITLMVLKLKIPIFSICILLTYVHSHSSKFSISID